MGCRLALRLCACLLWMLRRPDVTLQDGLLRDLEGGEKNIKQVKTRLKEVLQAVSGIPSRESLRSVMSDGNGMVMRMSE